MLLSKSCIYGLRASILLATKESNGFITIRDISDELQISFHFLTKVLQQLTRAELLESFKGPNGGVKLAKPADQITFEEIVTSIDGTYHHLDCPLGLSACGELAPCPMHNQWLELQNNIHQMIGRVTLSDLSKRQKTGKSNQQVSAQTGS